MNKVIITEVSTKEQLKEFVRFPDRLYRECHQYVPALHSDQVSALTKSPSLEYCTRKMWLASNTEGKTTGRICAVINPRYNERYDKKCCRFGWFDCVDDYEVARELTDTAIKWAKSQGMNQIHGPLYYNTLGKQGMLVEGFQNIPQFNTLYNFPYYPEYMQRLGFEKECDWIQYKVHGYQLPERIDKLARVLMERYQLHFADIETIKKDKNLGRQFLRDYSDIFSRSVYNFIPFTDAEIEEELKLSVPMLKNECCAIIMDKDEHIAAFGICFPSISKALQKAHGRLFPCGWAYLLKAMNCHETENDTADMMLVGADAKWEGKGLTAVLHYHMSQKFAQTSFRYFISNPQIETNNAVNVWENYSDKELFMRRRCFIKDIK